MQAFVTGGTGFVGYHVILQLLDQGWGVTAMHRPASQTRDLEALDVARVVASLEDRDSVVAAVPSNCDALFHVAANTNMWSANNRRQDADNVDGVQNIVEAALSKGVSRLIHTSSISAYGFHEGVVTESFPSTALNSGVNYMRTKYLGEQIVKRAVAERGLDAVILNPCAIIGANDRRNWSRLFNMVNKGTLPGVPPGKGSFCYVVEVAKAHVSAYHRGRRGENYILSGIDASYLELIQTIGSLLNKPTPHKPVPAFLLTSLAQINQVVSWITGKQPGLTPEIAKEVTRRALGSSEKATRELDYDPSIPLEDMLSECCEWLRQENLL